MVYRAEYMAQLQAGQAQKPPEFEAFLDTQRKHAQLMMETIPGLKDFYHRLLWSGDIEGALRTGTLQRIRKEGYFKTRTQFVTATKMREQFRPWSMQLLSESFLNIATPGGQDAPAEAWHSVDLVFQVKNGREKHLLNIDTEFFSPNLVIGGVANQFEDMEKFHIIWELDRDADDTPPQLIYMGFGANKPHGLGHVRDGETGINGKGRFYIYDPIPERFLEYAVEALRDEGPFDWQWRVSPPRAEGPGWSVTFVSMPDGSRIYLTDPIVVEASKDLTSEHAFSLFCEAAGIHPPLALATVSDTVRTAFLGKYRLCSLRLVEAVNQRPSTEPTIMGVANKAALDYAAYYAALLAPTVRTDMPEDLLKLLQQRAPHRYAQYQQILDTPCRDIFDDKHLSLLPETRGPLLSQLPNTITGELREVLEAWRGQMCSEMRKDVYHYGQNPYERIHLLRLGTLLATDDRFGGVYWKILDEAVKVARSKECYGEFDIVLPEDDGTVPETSP